MGNQLPTLPHVLSVVLPKCVEDHIFPSVVQQQKGSAMSGMRYIAVQSTDIRSIGYDREKELLHIKFRTGLEYVYSPVPSSVYTEFMDAKSYGRFFHQHIKDQYPYERVK